MKNLIDKFLMEIENCIVCEFQGKPCCMTKPWPACCASKYMWRYELRTMGKPTNPPPPRSCTISTCGIGCNPCGVKCVSCGPCNPCGPCSPCDSPCGPCCDDYCVGPCGPSVCCSPCFPPC